MLERSSLRHLVELPPGLLESGEVEITLGGLPPRRHPICSLAKRDHRGSCRDGTGALEDELIDLCAPLNPRELLADAAVGAPPQQVVHESDPHDRPGPPGRAVVTAGSISTAGWRAASLRWSDAPTRRRDPSARPSVGDTPRRHAHAGRSGPVQTLLTGGRSLRSCSDPSPAASSATEAGFTRRSIPAHSVRIVPGSTDCQVPKVTCGGGQGTRLAAPRGGRSHVRASHGQRS